MDNACFPESTPEVDNDVIAYASTELELSPLGELSFLVRTLSYPEQHVLAVHVVTDFRFASQPSNAIDVRMALEPDDELAGFYRDEKVVSTASSRPSISESSRQRECSVSCEDHFLLSLEQLVPAGEAETLYADIEIETRAGNTDLSSPELEIVLE